MATAIGHVSEVTVVVADDDVGLAGHPGVRRHLAERQAERGVVGVCRQRPDLVAGVEVLDLRSDASGAEPGDEPIAQERTDVGEARVAGCVRVARQREQLLAGSFGNHDDGVASPGEPIGEHIENPPSPSSVNGTSGTRHRFTSGRARAAFAAMKPA